MKKTPPSYKTRNAFLPLTTRGMLLLILSLYFLFGPARLNSDIIAAAFAFCALASLMLIFSLSQISKRRLKRNLHLTLSNLDTQGEEVSISRQAKEPVTLILKLVGVSVSPFFELRLRLVFKQEGIDNITHSLNSSSPSEQFITETIMFPHRGNWILEGVSIWLVDLLGFTTTALPFLELNQQIVVDSKPFHCPRWPVIASTIRVDDQIHHPIERRGDMYDLKQYHPADGSRRIVWKLFAKSGQLFSRYPEPAYSPEGKVALFCLAKKFDDKLVSETKAYLEELINLDIEIIVSTLSTEVEVAEDLNSTRNLLIENVWNSEVAEKPDIINSINYLIERAEGNNKERSIQTVLLAVSEDSLHDSKYQELIEACQIRLLQSGIRPSLFVSSSFVSSTIQSERPKSRALFMMKNLLFNARAVDNSNKDLIAAKAFIASQDTSTSDLAWS